MKRTRIDKPAGRKMPNTRCRTSPLPPLLALALLSIASGRPSAAVPPTVELPELAVCISGAARSLATVPVLRGLKKYVLHSKEYTAHAFAALSYDTNSPQLLEYNNSLSKQLSMPITVRRALGHLRPELQAVAFYNTSSAVERFRSCRASDARMPSTDVPALYGMQLCFSLCSHRYPHDALVTTFRPPTPCPAPPAAPAGPRSARPSCPCSSAAGCPPTAPA